MLVKRDRNHPSVFFWSVGNEEFVFTTDQGRRIAASMMALVEKLDPTRPVTAACDRPDKATIYDDVDVIGVNYKLQHVDMLHAHFPDDHIILGLGIPLDPEIFDDTFRHLDDQPAVGLHPHISYFGQDIALLVIQAFYFPGSDVHVPRIQDFAHRQIQGGGEIGMGPAGAGSLFSIIPQPPLFFHTGLPEGWFFRYNGRSSGKGAGR